MVYWYSKYDVSPKAPPSASLEGAIIKLMLRQDLGDKVKDPFALLALTILEEAFRNIRAYFDHRGTIEEMQEGKLAISWIKRMDGTFKIVAMASGMNLNDFHQNCLWKINKIREEVRNEHTRLEQKNQPGKIR